MRYFGSFVLVIVTWAMTNASPIYPDSSPACFYGAVMGFERAFGEVKYSFAQSFYV